MRRVVITGMGLVTPLGDGVEYNWNRLIRGESGIKTIDRFDVSDLPTKVGGMVPYGETEQMANGLFNPNLYVDIKDQRKMDTFILYAMAAAQQAIDDAGWHPTDPYELERTGVIIGSGIGGLAAIDATSQTLTANGPRRVSPFFIPSCLINLAAGHVSIRHGFQGPNHSVVTACATGAHAIGDAARLIQFGDADVMIAGSAEGSVCRIAFAGFNAARAMSTNFNDTPEKASRPWDKDRDGFVMGEGAGILVLEEYEHAKKRGAKIYAEVIGYGLSGDAHHITSPCESGGGAYRAMQAAIRNGKINGEEVDYVNAHGTSTPIGDAIEVKAIKRSFQDHAYKLSMSSTKSAIGHLLGGAGSVEAIFCALAIRDQVAPPTLNLDSPSEGCDLDFVPHQAKQRKIKVALSNSFGFGGTNASILLRAID